MAIPRQYTHTTVVPIPSDYDVRGVMGDSYDPDSALNVTKMFAGTEDAELVLNGTRVLLETTDKIGDRTSPLG
jgi:hypothetical protein